MKNKFILCLITSMPLMAHSEYYRNYIGRMENSLRSQEGLNIIITSQNFESGEAGATQIDTSEEIQVVVNGHRVNDNSLIRAVITPNCRSREQGWSIARPTVFLDLEAKTVGKSLDFAGQFKENILNQSAKHGGVQVFCQPQFSIVVDGAWQTDPINGTHNFKLNLF